MKIHPEIKKTLCRYGVKYAYAPLLVCTSAMILSSAAEVSAQDEYWHQRVSLFDKLPVGNDDIVFLGNSITDGGEFQELFGIENVLNRGIRSDRIDGVRKRLDQVTEGHPAKIFLLIGINDVADSRNTASSIAAKYATLVKEIREKSPESRLYIQSVMPINNDFRRYKSLAGRENIIPQLNSKLVEIAADNDAVFLDLWPALADPTSGKLRRNFTNDGLHLTGAGYRAWVGAIREYVLEGDVVPISAGENGVEMSGDEKNELLPADAEETETTKISIVKKME